jgi:O-methyltransferase
MARSADLELIKPHTKSDDIRLASMVEALNTIEDEGILGDIVECGVWRGGNIMLARMMCPDRICWLYDTFDGMTKPNAKLDVKPDGERAIDRWNLKVAGGTKWDAVSLEEVQQGFIGAGLGMDKLHFVEGPIEESVKMVAPIRISILRLDMDWHAPTKVALEKLYPRLTVGGFLIVDDYGHWMGCKKAVDDYFGQWRPSFTDVDYSCRVFRKC